MLKMSVEECPLLRVAAIRHVGPFTELGPVFQRVCGWAFQRQLFTPDTRVLGVFYDDPAQTAAAELRSDACVTVSHDVEPDEASGVELREVPAGRYAVGILQGPYEGLREAYPWLHGQWLPSSGYVAKPGPVYEVYLNDATTTPPDQLLTAIHVPLED